jgi:DNA-binding transcriptional MocR family regulator
VESPTYVGALDAMRAAGARLLSIPVGEAGATAAAAGRLLARALSRLVYVTPSFNNPTGAVMPAAERRRLARLAAEAQVPVTEDHALADLAFGHRPRRPSPPRRPAAWSC